MRGLLLFALLLAEAAAAQDPPELLRVSIAGPATWRARLQPTDLGSLLASAAAESVWRGYVDGIDRTLRGVRGADEAFAADRARLLDYGGTLHVVAWLEQAEDALHVPRWSAALIAEPDGHSDLAAMAGASAVWLDRLGERASNAWRDLRAGAPQMHDGRLVIVLAEEGDRVAATARARAMHLPPLDPRDVLRLEGMVGPLLGLLRDRAWERGLVADLLGAATQRVTVRGGSFGPDVAVSVQVDFAAMGERGVFAGVVPRRNGVPELAALVPEEPALHGAWRVDWVAAWSAFCRIWAGITERAPEQARARLATMLGADVATAVAPLLRDDVLFVCGRGDGSTGDVPFVRAGLVVPVHDEAALIDALTPIVQRLGHLPWRSDDGGWHGRLGEVFELTVGDGVVCLTGAGNGGAVVAAVRARAAERGVPAPKTLDRGDGVSGAGAIDVVAFAARELPAALRLVPILFGIPVAPPALTEFAAEVARWEPLLRQHQLLTARAELRGRQTDVIWRVVW